MTQAAGQAVGLMTGDFNGQHQPVRISLLFKMDLSSSSSHTVTRVKWTGPGSHSDHLNCKLSFLQSNSCLVDVSLVCQSGEIVYCHKVVIASVSCILRKLLEENDEKVGVSIILTKN